MAYTRPSDKINKLVAKVSEARKIGTDAIMSPQRLSVSILKARALLIVLALSWKVPKGNIQDAVNCSLKEIELAYRLVHSSTKLSLAAIIINKTFIEPELSPQ